MSNFPQYKSRDMPNTVFLVLLLFQIVVLQPDFQEEKIMMGILQIWGND